jgi:cell division septation protein DedD
MSDVMQPSWRVRPPERESSGWGIPPKFWMIGAGLAGSVALAGAIIWGMSMMGPRGVPLIETDGRPFKVRPDSPGGAVVPNQQELIFERGNRQDRPAEARLGPPPEAPRPDALRAQSQPPPAPAAPAATPAPAAVAAAPAGRPAATPPPAQQAARPAPATGGRFMVQFAATRSEEAARADWERLQRRAPELAGRQPIITRLERDGQPTLWRLRTGGFADAAAARAFCASLRAREVACIPAGG